MKCTPHNGLVLALALASASVLLAASSAASDAAVSTLAADYQSQDLLRLVAVTDDLCVRHAGCDGISVFDIERSGPIFSGSTIVSPGRLAATSDFSTIIAINTNHDAPFLYYANRNSLTEYNWRVKSLIGANFISAGGIAIAPDDDTLLVATAAVVARGGTVETGPYAVEKYSLSELAVDRLGPRRGSIVVPSRAAEIIPTPDGRLAHIFTVTGHVLTIDIASMREVAPTVQAPPLVYGGWDASKLPAPYGHATISPDLRYLIANRWGARQVSLVDLVNRTATTIDVPLLPTAGVAFSYGPHNTGLLAVHGIDRVGLFEFRPPATLRHIVSTVVPPPRIPTAPDCSSFGPYASVAWSGDGSHLVAASSDFRQGRLQSFVVFRVDGAKGRITLRHRWSPCPAPGPMVGPWFVSPLSYPNDILTLNRPAFVPPTPTPSPSATNTPTPTSTPTASASPTATPTSTPTASASPTATPTSSATPHPSATPTQKPSPCFLPLALSEQCVPEKRHVDVALVIDASTTMRDEPTSAGRPKLEAAVEAAEAFLDLLALPNDQAALIVFNNSATMLQELTGDRRLLSAAFRRITVQLQTRIHLGVALARDELRSPRRRLGNQPILIVLTDGKANPESPELAVHQAQAAKAEGIAVFTIGLGTEENIDVDALRRMASQPAYYYHAPDGEDLLGIYTAIAIAIPCNPESFWARR